MSDNSIDGLGVRAVRSRAWRRRPVRPALADSRTRRDAALAGVTVQSHSVRFPGSVGASLPHELIASESAPVLTPPPLLESTFSSTFALDAYASLGSAAGGASALGTCRLVETRRRLGDPAIPARASKGSSTVLASPHAPLLAPDLQEVHRSGPSRPAGPTVISRASRPSSTSRPLRHPRRTWSPATSKRASRLPLGTDGRGAGAACPSRWSPRPRRVRSWPPNLLALPLPPRRQSRRQTRRPRLRRHAVRRCPPAPGTARSLSRSPCPRARSSSLQRPQFRISSCLRWCWRRPRAREFPR